MDMCVTGTEYDVFQYKVNHRNSWISEDSIAELNSIPFSSYLLSQENVRELIKIEEMDPTSDDGGCCSSGANQDSKDVYTFCKEEYMGDESEISSTQFPSEIQLMFYVIPHQTEKPCKCNKCESQFTMKKYSRQHQIIPTGEKPIKYNEYGKQSSQISCLNQSQIIHNEGNVFTCDDCGKQFSHNSSLNIHKVILEKKLSHVMNAVNNFHKGVI